MKIAGLAAAVGLLCGVAWVKGPALLRRAHPPGNSKLAIGSDWSPRRWLDPAADLAASVKTAGWHDHVQMPRKADEILPELRGHP